ncbi:CD0519/CD1768 family membrane protein [Crassaminicella profunda]|uniref:CD0519/CD1768 family membrane protein n=1 Tax=Crassaminicella profunda TaxID=1286698 RepID=UPI0031B7F37A
MLSNTKTKKEVSMETYVFLIILIVSFWYLASTMGIGIMFNVIMKTAHELLINTVFFILAIAVLAGAFSSLLSEFGIVSLINKIISPIMRLIYNLPGAASLGAITTYLSDNPAIISLAKDIGFSKYFKDYQTPALCNLGTSFGMGLILTTFMISQGKGTEFIIPSIIGNFGAFIGSIISVKLMLRFTKKYYNYDEHKEKNTHCESTNYHAYRKIRDGNAFERALDAILEGGKNGVEMGMAIIPGVLFICTIIMILTFGPTEVKSGISIYKGTAFEGIALLPKLGQFISPIIKPLFGFKSVEAIAFPITSLGSVGAALGLVTKFLEEGLIGPNDIAVFTAMGMCWSGYLSTHVGMMDALGVRQLANKAILSHTIGGLCAGIFSHYLYVVYSLIFSRV